MSKALKLTFIKILFDLFAIFLIFLMTKELSASVLSFVIIINILLLVCNIEAIKISFGLLKIEKD